MAHWLWGDRPEQEGLPRQDGDGPGQLEVLSALSMRVPAMLHVRSSLPVEVLAWLVGRLTQPGWTATRHRPWRPT
jgi:hypothetical protein